MSWMFWNAENFSGDLSSWNVSNVTDMNHMFLLPTISQVTFQVGMYLM